VQETLGSAQKIVMYNMPQGNETEIQVWQQKQQSLK
jgi:hypothetical protein